MPPPHLIIMQNGGSVRTRRNRAPITLSKQERESLRLPAGSGALLSLGRDVQAAHRFIVLCAKRCTAHGL